jgi:hypothetical protein
VEKHYEQWLFTISIIFLTGFLGGVSGLLIGLVIFSKMCPAQLPFFSQVEPTAIPVVVVMETPTPPPPTASPVPPTATLPLPTATPTLLASPSPTPTLTATATRVFIPPPPTPTIPPSVYVTNVRTDPSPAKQKQDVTFYVSFLNTTGQDRTYRWFVYIYEQNQSNPVGQTSSDKDYVIPPGTSDQVTINTWRYGPGLPCTTYIAKIHWVHQDGSKPTFAKVGGTEAAFPFMLCP